jgi:uncharacterized membrane protein YdjX (TVP38/TMEM64 family)
MKNRLKVIAWVLALAAVIILFRVFNIQEHLANILSWIEELGFAGYFVYILLYIAACIFLLPGSVLTLGAGFIYGVGKGSILVSAASTLGASAAFLVGRCFAREMVRRKIDSKKSFKDIDEAVSKEGRKIVFLLRLSPVFPFNILNYSLGLTGIRFRDYFFASWIGMIPGTVMFVYLGSLAGNLASVGTDEGTGRSVLEWALYGAGLAATVAVTVFITKIARNALNKKIPLKDGGMNEERV